MNFQLPPPDFVSSFPLAALTENNNLVSNCPQTVIGATPEKLPPGYGLVSAEKMRTFLKFHSKFSFEVLDTMSKRNLAEACVDVINAGNIHCEDKSKILYLYFPIDCELAIKEPIDPVEQPDP